ncbi:MAG: transposase [Candidatus Magasanikbacteria bacterium]|nr:transposase [Candidatus Magasanikbacteria bacterium]
MAELFKNKFRIPSARLPGYDYGQPGFYFVTICAELRVCYFGDVLDGEMVLNDAGKIVLNELLKTPQIRPNVTLDEFVVMPNHLHIIIIINEIRSTTSVAAGLVAESESVVETHCNASLHERPRHDDKPYHNKFGPQRNNLASIVRGFKSTTTKQINKKYGHKYFAWQSRFYDHIIRDEISYNNIQYYIQQNPAKWWRDRNNHEGLLM